MKGNANILLDHLFQWPNYLHALTITTIVAKLLDWLRVAQEHDTMLQKYLLLAYSTQVDYSIYTIR